MRQFSGQTLLPSNRWRTRWTSQSCAKRSVEGETFSQGRDAVRNVKCAFGAWQFKELDSSLQYCRAANVLWSKGGGGRWKITAKRWTTKPCTRKTLRARPVRIKKNHADEMEVRVLTFFLHLDFSSHLATSCPQLRHIFTKRWKMPAWVRWPEKK